MNQNWLQTLLPFLILAVVFALRFRNMKKARPLKVGRLWIAPALITLVAGFVLVTMPPSALGWLAFFGSAAIGAAVGWKRAHLMHLERDPESGDLMMRQTPAALILLLGIVGVRRLVSYESSGSAASTGSSGKLAGTALVFTDAALGFGLGMVVAMRLTLWLRAREH